jgi:hypothetical protein
MAIELALQLLFSCEVGFLRGGLMRASPERPCDEVCGSDIALTKTDGDAPDFLDGPADQRLVVSRLGSFFGIA